MKKLDGRTVLVVDDELDILEIMTDEFECAGAKVLTASNGTTAFEIVKSVQLDAVVSDIRMPGGDGMELLIRSKEFNPDRPVVLLITGYTDHTNQEAYDRGASAILSKPCDFDQLIDSVSLALAERRERYVRKHERLKTDLTVKLNFPNMGKSVEAQVINIGRGGMYIALSTDLPKVGEKISFKIVFDGAENNSMVGNAICRWVRTSPNDQQLPDGVGIEFIALSQETFEAIESLLKMTKEKANIPIR